MRIAIVEDRPEDLANLSELLAGEVRQRGWMCVVDTYDSGEGFLTAAEVAHFDIVFLDIIMGGIDGLETAGRFRARAGDALLVFVSVDAGYAVEGYEVDASAFLVKPATPERFHRVMDRLERKMEKDAVVSLSPGVEIPVGAVRYATITDHYLKVYAAGAVYSPNLSMEEFLKLLPAGRFFECSRGVLVNVDHVVRVGAKAVEMDGGVRLPVSRRRRQALLEGVAARIFTSVRRDLS